MRQLMLLSIKKDMTGVQDTLMSPAAHLSYILLNHFRGSQFLLMAMNLHSALPQPQNLLLSLKQTRALLSYSTVLV